MENPYRETELDHPTTVLQTGGNAAGCAVRFRTVEVPLSSGLTHTLDTNP